VAIAGLQPGPGSWRSLLAFVTYDLRLLDAAKAAGMPTASPGQN
jgi:hypothetical protein